MTFDDAFLRAIENAQKSLAVDALTKPQNRDAFEYGRVAGMYGGLEHAKSLLLAILDDEKAKEQEN